MALKEQVESNVHRILAILSCSFFVIGSISYFLYYKELDLIFEQYIFYINYVSIYLFSLLSLLLSKKIILKTLTILSCSISLSKIFYNLMLYNIESIVEKRMMFVLSCISFMILHTVIWLATEINKKWKN